MTAYYKKIIFDNRIHYFISENFCLVQKQSIHML